MIHHTYFFQFDFSCEMSDLSIELELVSSECSLLLFFLLKNLRQGVSTAVSSLSVSQHGDHV